jgi:pyruvate ferredoxin oxidoreductase delta subunit
MTCIGYCPEGCINLEGNDKKKAKINYDYCKGCLICMSVCPFKAIEKGEEK